MAKRGITGSPKAIEQLRLAEQIATKQRESDLKEVLSTPAGRRLLMDIIDRRCNAHGTGYSNSGSEMYYLCGQRSVGVQLREDCKRLDEQAYGQMLLEGLTNAKEARIRAESAEAKAQEDEDEGDF